MSGPEVPLMRELRNAVVLGDPGGKVHRAGKFASPPDEGSKSQNYPLAEAGAALASGWKVPEQLARFQRAYEAARMPPRPGVSTGWMGSEQEARIYDGMHYCPWFVAYRAGAPGAREWLQAFHAIAMLSRTTGGRVLWVGQRSAIPGSHGHRFVDGLMDVATGGGVARWRKGWRREDGTFPPDWDILEHLAKEIRAFHLEHIEGRTVRELLELVSHFHYRVPRNWLHTEAGNVIASWCESTVNPNTPPMMAAVVQADGSLQWLPHEGGEKRIRGAHDGATCVFEPVSMTLRYQAKHSTPSPATIDLDPGPYVWTRVAEDGSVTHMVVERGMYPYPNPVAFGAANPVPLPPVDVPACAEAVRLTVDLRRSGAGSWSAAVVSQEVIG